MLERWIIASLVIGVLVGMRLLLRRFMQPYFAAKDSKTNIDTCMTSGCKSLRSSCGK